MNEIEHYISKFPLNVQEKLNQIRAIIIENAPNASEMISYGMPAYKTDGKPLLYFGGYKNHIGFYAIPSGHAKFSNELANYKQGKGSVQFGLDKPIPYDLIEKIVKFRVHENAAISKKK